MQVLTLYHKNVQYMGVNTHNMAIFCVINANTVGAVVVISQLQVLCHTHLIP